MSLGQFRIVEEAFFFLIGIIIVSFILFTFTSIERELKASSIQDHFSSVLHHIANAIVKAAEQTNTTVYLSIPKKLCEKPYVIMLNGDTLIVYDYENPSVNVSQKLFNLGERSTLSGQVFSTAGFIKIKSYDDKIIISRW